MKVYVVRSDYGHYTDAFLKNNYVGIGWFETRAESYDLESIREHYQKEYPEDAKMRKAVNVGQINRFINKIQIGDFIITPYSNQNLIIGQIESDLYFEEDSSSYYTMRRKVKWLKEAVNRTIFSIPLQNTLRSSQTVFEVSQLNEILECLGKKPKGDNKVAVSVNSLSMYDIVKDHLLELDAAEFELLVSYVLGTMGFEATQQMGFVGDGGIDFEGVLNVMGIASINLEVQVKRYAKGTIGEMDIRNFRGALKKDHQGCFITLSRFAKKAIDSANDPNKVPISLINGNQFIDIFIEQYDKILEAISLDDNDELLSKLKFKKMLIPE